VTRVIAGQAGGRRLRVPAGPGTRPTADRAREGLFSTLLSLTDLEGARVLDLYAGSGALGLEALSRGAGAAVLVDAAAAALRALGANVEAVGLPGAVVVAMPVAGFLAGEPASYGGLFDVALLDPPYDDSYDDEVLPALVALARWLVPGAVVAVERRSREPAPAWPEPYRPVRARRYGEATLWYGSRS